MWRIMRAALKEVGQYVRRLLAVVGVDVEAADAVLDYFRRPTPTSMQHQVWAGTAF